MIKSMKFLPKHTLAAVAVTLFTWSCDTAPKDESLKAGLKEDVTYLAADDLGGRAIGTEGEQKAAEYLAA
jgi:hypothetical protein